MDKIKELLKLAVDRYLNQYEFIILPATIAKCKEILQLHAGDQSISAYDNGICGPPGPRGFSSTTVAPPCIY